MLPVPMSRRTTGAPVGADAHPDFEASCVTNAVGGHDALSVLASDPDPADASILPPLDEVDPLSVFRPGFEAG
jgi:hypothetical protein